MMIAADADPVDVQARKGLEGTPYDASSLQPLTGGIVNWGYVATLSTPLDDNTTDVFVKHGEKYMASIPDFPLDLERCRMEAQILSLMTTSPFTGRTSPRDPKHFSIRTPQLLHFDEPTTTQVHEYIPSSTPLKAYALDRLAAPTDPARETQCRLFGKAVGKWMNEFVRWAAEHPQAREVARGNVTAQPIKQMVSYGWLAERVEQFPEVLREAKETLESVERMAAEELRDEERLQVVHGDFSTGNILLPGKVMDGEDEYTAFVIDWECVHLAPAHFDLGQLVGELYTLWLCKDIVAGLWLIEGIVGAFEGLDDELAYRVAIHAGAHLICMTASRPEWGDHAKLQEVAREGRDILVHAWEKDRPWFENGRLACFFNRKAPK